MKSTLIATASLALWSQSPLLAQPAQDEGAEEVSKAGGDQSSESPDIVVTAQSREERLNDIPIQVEAFTEEAIENAGIRSTGDLLEQIPNATFDIGNNYSSSFVTMRGLTQINNADPPVAFVIDGVSQTDQSQIGVDLSDIERVEVLRGPQGSLYGRNAVGGAINIITKAPTGEFEGFARTSYASGDTVEAAAGVTVPILDQIAGLRLSGSYRTSDGQILNTFLNENVDFIDHDWSLRGRLYVTPAPALTVDLIGAYREFKAGSNYYSPVFSGDPNDFVLPEFNIPGAAIGNSSSATGRIGYEFGFATLTSITGRTSLEQIYRSDIDFRNPVNSPGGFLGLGFQAGAGQDFEISTFSQEFRLVSPSRQSFRWLVGAYYLSTDRNLRTRVFIDLTSDPDQINNPAQVIADLNEDNDNEAFAFFGQVDIDLLPELTLTLGLRYDEDQRQQTNLNTGAVRTAIFDHLQPKVTVSYRPDEDKLLYATYSTGFRSGGFNAPGVAVPIFPAETIENYELGFKSQWLDNRISINGALFQTGVNNYQYFFVDIASGSQIIDGIDSVRIQGLELEIQGRPHRDILAEVALGVADTEIRESRFPTDEGNRTPRTVPVTATASLQYSPDFGNNLEGLFRVDYKYIGDKYWTTDSLDVQKPYQLLNARVGFTYGNFSLHAFVENLLDESFYTDYFTPPFSGLDVELGFLGQPRRFGIEARVRF